MTSLSSCKRVDESVDDGKSFVHFNMQMAQMGFYRSEFLENIFESINSSEAMEKAITVNDIIKSGIMELSSIGSTNSYIVEKHEMIQSTPQEENIRNRRLCKNALIAIFRLDYLMDINFPEYKGVRLKRSIKTKLSSINKEECFVRVKYK